MAEQKVVWQPHTGPQSAFCNCPVFEIFFGGARGGGKTDAVLGRFAMHAGEYGENAIGIMFRRKRTELVEAIERSKMLYKPLGAKFNEQDKLWRFPNGARLRFAYLENDSDADNYQGHNYTVVAIEEIGTFPSPAPILKLMATLRSGAKRPDGSRVPVGFWATGNPGGPGHQWVKERYVEWAPKGMTARRFEYVSPFDGQVVSRDRIFIPSRLSDNPTLGADYVANLYMSGSAELVRAWLTGDWNVVQGAYFSEFGQQHIVEPFEIPRHWLRIRAMDWGSYRPFAVLWGAVSDGSVGGIPAGAIVVYRELYGAASANVGLKLPADVVARRIKELEQFDNIGYGVCDPAMAQSDGGPSIKERMGRVGVHWTPGDNKRLPGWSEVRARLRGAGGAPAGEGAQAGDGPVGGDTPAGDGAPMLYVFSTVTDLIRTLPALQHDAKKPEDLDSDGEDHAADALRYLCMSRPYIRGAAAVVKAAYMGMDMPIDKIIELSEAREARRSKI